MTCSWSPPRINGFAEDGVTVKTWDCDRITRERHQHNHRTPSVRRALRGGAKDQWNYVYGPKKRLLAKASERVHSYDGSVIPFRTPKPDEAWFAVDAWLRNRYSLRLTDVVITEQRGMWIAKQSCCEREHDFCCNPFCGGRMRHTYSLWEGHRSSLMEWGEYEGGGPHRDKRGRMMSPYRSWLALYREAERVGSPIARYSEDVHTWVV